MQTDVAVQRKGQIGSVRWVRGLIGQQLGLGGQRQALEVAPASDSGQPRSPEGVRLEHLDEPSPQLPKVQVAQLARIIPWPPSPPPHGPPVTRHSSPPYSSLPL